MFGYTIMFPEKLKKHFGYFSCVRDEMIYFECLLFLYSSIIEHSVSY